MQWSVAKTRLDHEQCKEVLDWTGLSRSLKLALLLRQRKSLWNEHARKSLMLKSSCQEFVPSNNAVMTYGGSSVTMIRDTCSGKSFFINTNGFISRVRESERERERERQFSLCHGVHGTPFRRWLSSWQVLCVSIQDRIAKLNHHFSGQTDRQEK